jgi:predicted metalloprotease
VLGSTEAQWTNILAKDGVTYRKPRLVMFSGMTRSACGAAQSAMGPFYCPNDREVYLDTSFFRELETRFHGCSGKACDFSKAYVIAHEVGHHVQNLLGILPKVQEAQRASASRTQSNQLQVRVELQADCLAGVWGHTAAASLAIDEADLREALNAAHSIGDDTLGARESQYTHGTSNQRMAWFRRGFDSGDARQCDTFAVRDYRSL